MLTRRAASLTSVFVLVAACASAQVPYDEAIGGLSSKDPKVRLRSATLLKESAYPQSAIPLAKLISDPDNAVQLEAIAAEVNIFTAGKGGPRRVGIVTIEDRTRAAAQQVFDAGPLVLGTAPVPPSVLLTLRLATRDDSPKVSLEALYAFGALGIQLTGRPRRDMLQSSIADLSTLLNVQDPALRLAAVRVIGRLWARRPGEPPLDAALGNLVIAAVNENSREMKLAAMETLGLLRERRAVDGLTELFQFYGKGELAEAALTALSRIGDKASAPLFVMQLGSKSAAIKTIAIEGLARIGDPSYATDIQSALKREHDDRVIAASTFAAAMLTNGPIEQLVDALNRPKAHDAAMQYLIDIAPGRVARMSRYAQDPSPRMRMDVADIVGLSGDPAGIAVVEPLLKDADKDVALAAQRATVRLQAAR